ncbi:Low-affinity inorganic phosphate transporter [Granulibacter bethesdensis]|nr:Low-affinity inorganic phosphate transporter [Granulibacter bethesdensis]
MMSGWNPTQNGTDMVMPTTSKAGQLTGIIVSLLLVIGVVYAAFHLSNDLEGVSYPTALPFVLLGIALAIALGFEFVNGFHDTANAVATVIYTNSLPAHFAVVWSGVWNFLGVLASSGGVAFTVVSLLPVELILQVGSDAGFAMVFALLVAAILWNLATWYVGIPNSSSHTLIGSIIGVGLMNQLMAGPNGTSGVDWAQALNVLRSLLFSPVAGFLLAGLGMLLLRGLVKIPTLYKAPEGKQPPPWPIRALLILTCTGVSFSHGSNDGQKGMGLIMLILIGTVPTAYALNHTVDGQKLIALHHSSLQTVQILDDLSAARHAPAVSLDAARNRVTAAIQKKKALSDTASALAALIKDVNAKLESRVALRDVPHDQAGNIRNDFYLISHALPFVEKTAPLTPQQKSVFETFTAQANNATQFIPLWVKVCVALALGLGTMVGWRRIVVTVGERIGKEHLTYAQGAVAESVAMGLIQAADMYHLPVSTTHVLTSGVAGTMAANGSGLQAKTVRSLLMAWVLTLPASILLAGGLFWAFRSMFTD